MIRLFDSHAHLQDVRYLPALAQVRERWRNANVVQIASCGSCPDDWKRLAELTSQMREIVPSFGLHPWYLKEAVPSWHRDLTAMLERFPNAGIGEIGLDYAISSREDRKMHEIFTAQWDIAAQMDRIVSLHCRRAWDVLPALLRTMKKPARGFMVHSFSGGTGQVDSIIQLGGYISFSGAITRHRNRRGIDACRAVPLDRLLIETDSPDILPSGIEKSVTGRILNEPANLPLVLNRVADIRGVSPSELAEITYSNAVRFFGSD